MILHSKNRYKLSRADPVAEITIVFYLSHVKLLFNDPVQNTPEPLAPARQRDLVRNTLAICAVLHIPPSTHLVQI